MASEDIPGTTHGGSATFLSVQDVMDKSSEKARLRAIFRNARDDFVDSLSANERERAFSVAPTPLKSLLRPGLTVAAYVAVGSEADPMRLLNAANDMGCGTALPHVTSKAAPMRFLRWSPGDPLETGAFNLQQPLADRDVCSPDIVLVPLTAFDESLMRLGQGAGHYDRALSILDSAIAIGIAWSMQQTEQLPTDLWDIPLDAVLTEKAWLKS